MLTKRSNAQRPPIFLLLSTFALLGIGAVVTMHSHDWCGRIAGGVLFVVSLFASIAILEKKGGAPLNHNQRPINPRRIAIHERAVRLCCPVCGTLTVTSEPRLDKRYDVCLTEAASCVREGHYCDRCYPKVVRYGRR